MFADEMVVYINDFKECTSHFKDYMSDLESFVDTVTSFSQTSVTTGNNFIFEKDSKVRQMYDAICIIVIMIIKPLQICATTLCFIIINAVVTVIIASAITLTLTPRRCRSCHCHYHYYYHYQCNYCYFHYDHHRFRQQRRFCFHPCWFVS